jgi:hypothetical protein
MVMKRYASFVVAGVVGLVVACGLGGCNKPTADDCRLAIANMEKLLGTDTAAKNVDPEGEVRRCKGGSTREAVDCAVKATTLDQLKACEFMGSKAKTK